MVPTVEDLRCAQALLARTACLKEIISPSFKGANIRGESSYIKLGSVLKCSLEDLLNEHKDVALCDTIYGVQLVENQQKEPTDFAITLFDFDNF